MLKKLLVGVCLLFAPVLLYGQSAQLSGYVKDSSGGSVANASVELRDQDTGVRQQVRTNSEGIYNLAFLKPGTYVATVQAKGFKTLTREKIVLSIDERASVDFSLEVGAVSEVVTIQGGGLNLNTSDGSVSTLVDEKTVANMPLNGRSFQDLILLTPGTVTNTPQSGGNGLGQTGEFSVNGQRTEENYYTVDGVSASAASRQTIIAGGGSLGSGLSGAGSMSSSTALGTTQSIVSVDALQEFRVQSSTYSAEYGRTPGGQFAFQTRSGTNQWHGDAYDYLRNNYFDARDWFTAQAGLPESALRQNDFGGALGGPVRIPGVYNGKDKTFFFVNYEGLRLANPQEAGPLTVPDDCMRGIPGPTSCANVLANYGISRMPAYSSTTTPGLLPIMNLFPLPTSYPSAAMDAVIGVGQVREGFSNTSSINSTSVRFDQVINDKMTAFFRFSDANSNVQSPNYETVSSTPFLNRTYTGGVNNIFSSQWSNEFRINYTLSTVETSGSITAFGGNSPLPTGGFDLAKYLGVPDGSSITIGTVGQGAFHIGDGGAAGDVEKQWNIIDTVSYTVGAHQLKFGVDYRRLSSAALTSPASLLYQFFDEPSIESGMYGLGVWSSQNSYFPLTKNFSAFVNDNWKISRRLSLSFGLRWEVNPASTVTQGMLPYTIVGTNQSNFALSPENTQPYATTWFNLAPRLGAAYTVRDAPGWETVARGGFGVYFDTGQQTGLAGFSGPGYSAFSFDFSGANAFPGPGGSVPLPNLTSFADLTNPANQPLQQIIGFSPHLQLPYTLEWNASVEQSLGKSQALTVSYVGSHAARLLQQNKYIPSAIGITNNNATDFTIIANGQTTADFNSLQVQYQRRLARGLTVLGSYTWSHCIDYGSVNSFTVYQRGNCDMDVRHNFSVAISYDLPNVGSNGIVRAIVDHWGVDTRFTARTAFPVFLSGSSIFTHAGEELDASYYTVLGQDGKPLPPYLTGAKCNQFFGPLFSFQGLPDVCPGGKAINPCAFEFANPNPDGTTSVPAQLPYITALENFHQNPCGLASDSSGHLVLPAVSGIAPRNQLRGFGALQWDLAIRREFPIYNKLKLQFRAEAFNILNHPNFGFVSTDNQNGDGFGLSTGTLGNSLGVLNSAYQMGGPRSMQFALKLIF